MQPQKSFRPGEAPGDDDDDDDSDGVEVEGMMGTLDQSDVSQVFDDHQDAVTRCYNDVVGAQYYVAGSLGLSARVGHDGAVETVMVASSDLGSYQIESCILGVVRSMRFPHPEGGPAANISYTYTFSPRYTVEAWDPSKIADAIAKLKPPATPCTQPIPANAAATLYLGPGGVVESVGLQADEPIDDTWAKCVVGLIGAWTLTPPDANIVKVTVPLAGIAALAPGPGTATQSPAQTNNAPTHTTSNPGP
jgi:hypothetical protein